MASPTSGLRRSCGRKIVIGVFQIAPRFAQLAHGRVDLRMVLLWRRSGAGDLRQHVH